MMIIFSDAVNVDSDTQTCHRILRVAASPNVWFNLGAQKSLNGDNSWLTSPFSAGTKAAEFFTQEGQRLGQ